MKTNEMEEMKVLINGKFGKTKQKILFVIAYLVLITFDIIISKSYLFDTEVYKNFANPKVPAVAIIYLLLGYLTFFLIYHLKKSIEIFRKNRKNKESRDTLIKVLTCEYEYSDFNNFKEWVESLESIKERKTKTVNKKFKAMKTKIVISAIVAIATVLYLISITTAPFDHTVTFSQMPWDGTKIYISYIILISAMTFGILPWIPYFIRKYNGYWNC